MDLVKMGFTLNAYMILDVSTAISTIKNLPSVFAICTFFPLPGDLLLLLSLCMPVLCLIKDSAL